MADLGPLDQTNILVAIITGVAGLVISALLAIKELYLSFFIKAKLSIEYDSKLDGTCVREDWAHYRDKDHGIMSSSHRKYFSVIVKNNGKSITENCTAYLTSIPSQSNAKVLPSSEDKQVMWDSGETFRTIGAKKGKAILNLVFSQEDFKNVQIIDKETHVPEDRKIYAKISTPNSVNYAFPSPIMAFAEDGLRMGDTFFRLSVNTINGESTEAIIKVTVTNNWRELSLQIRD